MIHILRSYLPQQGGAQVIRPLGLQIRVEVVVRRKKSADFEIGMAFKKTREGRLALGIVVDRDVEPPESGRQIERDEMIGRKSRNRGKAGLPHCARSVRNGAEHTNATISVGI